MKKLALAILLMAGVAHAGDLTTGYTFTSGEQNVTHTKLNNQVNNAVINTSFFTDKSAVTTAAKADTLLMYSSGNAAFRRITVGSLLYSNSTLITGATEDTAPAAGDYLLTYDVSAAGLKKATGTSLFFENDALINARTNWNTPNLDSFFLAYTGGAWAKIARTNLFHNWATFATFTNLAMVVPVAADALLLWDASGATNTQTTLSNLLATPTLTSGVTNGHLFLSLNTTNGALEKVTAANLRDYITNNIATIATTNLLPMKFAGTNGMPAAGALATFTHGLAGFPQIAQVWLVCTNADAATGYAAGDQIDMHTTRSDNRDSLVSVMRSATTVTTRFNSTATFQLLHKTTGVNTSVTSRDNFIVRCDAVYFP